MYSLVSDMLEMVKIHDSQELTDLQKLIRETVTCFNYAVML